jgi:hypothetical protein
MDRATMLRTEAETAMLELARLARRDRENFTAFYWRVHLSTARANRAYARWLRRSGATGWEAYRAYAVRECEVARRMRESAREFSRRAAEREALASLYPSAFTA